MEFTAEMIAGLLGGTIVGDKNAHFCNNNFLQI